MAIEDWVTCKEAAELTGQGESTARRWAKIGTVEAQKKGGTWLIKASTLPDKSHRVGSLVRLRARLRELIEEYAATDRDVVRAIQKILEES